MVELKEIIEEIKKLSREFKKQNGNIKIPANKDMNLWLINYIIQHDSRISKNESAIKTLKWTITISIPVLLFIITLIK